MDIVTRINSPPRNGLEVVEFQAGGGGKKPFL
jgi:hypothetical protein